MRDMMSKAASDRFKQTFFPLSILLALNLLYFWRIIFRTGSMLSYDPLSGGDLNGYLYPIHSFLATTLRSGNLPLWNPWSYCGYPQFADMQTGVFYPLNWVLPLLVNGGHLSYWGYEVFSISHAFLAGVFTFLFVHYLLKRRMIALFAAILFEFNGYVSIYYSTPTVLGTVAWMPLTLLFVIVSIKKESWPWLIPAGLSMAMSFLAGYLEVFVFIFYFISAYFIASMAYHKKLKHLYYLIIFASVTIGITAVQWVPTLELSTHAAGKSFSYSHLTGNIPYSFLNPSLLYTLIFPRHYEWNGNIYIGLAAAILIGAVIFLSNRKLDIFKDFNCTFFAAAGIVSLLLAMGRSTFFYTAFYLLLPGISYGRTPIMFTFIFVFCISITSSYMLSILLSPMANDVKRQLNKYTKYIFFSVILMFLVNISQVLAPNADASLINNLTFMVLMAALCSFIVRLRVNEIIGVRQAASIILILLIFDLFSNSILGKFTNDNPPGRHYNENNELVEYLKSEEMRYRSHANNFYDVFPDGSSSVYAVPVDNGYWIRLNLKEYLLFRGVNLNMSTDYSKEELDQMRLPEGRILDMLNVRYVIQ